MPCKRPFLTIGIASYNYCEYLEKALGQIKRQGFTDYEILYCDDGSTDDSVSRIKQYIEQEKEMTIRLVEGRHEGILANRNRILDHARGKYLFICDADDYMMDGCLDALCHAARETNADCVIGGFCEITDDGRILKKHIPAADSSKWLYTWHHGQIYRLDIVKEHAIRFEEIPDDVMYLQRIHKVCENVCFVPQNVYAWRRHTRSTSAAYIKDDAWHPVRLWEKIAVFMSGLRIYDETAIHYYLYKWYYFNISDLWQENRRQIKKDLCIMQKMMRDALPDYQSVVRIHQALRVKDTLLARAAVMLCFGLERLHLIYIITVIRKLQNRLR